MSFKHIIIDLNILKDESTRNTKIETILEKFKPGNFLYYLDIQEELLPYIESTELKGKITKKYVKPTQFVMRIGGKIEATDNFGDRIIHLIKSSEEFFIITDLNNFNQEFLKEYKKYVYILD